MTESQHEYNAEGGRGQGRLSVKWNGIGLAGKQVLLLLFSLILARILGPTSVGIIAQASVYIALTMMLLDQGLTMALISRDSVSRNMIGAAATVNMSLALLMALITVPLAGILADFFDSSDLESVLIVLGCGLILKAVAISPRVLCVRRLNFRSLAIIETFGALVGGGAALVVALMYQTYWSLVVQILVTDLVIAVCLLGTERPSPPNFKWRSLRESFGFSAKVFVGDMLNFTSRNADTVLIARFLGQAQVGLYSMAYKIMVVPIQLLGQAVTRVLFPLISRRREDKKAVAEMVLSCMRTLSLISFPVMAFVSVASGDLIALVLGYQWLESAPVLTILAITGARQTVTSLNAPIMLGYSRPDIHLRFAITATVVQVAAMCAGLQFGILGVAIGYTVAELLLTPVIFLIVRKLTGVSLRDQIRSLIPAIHASCWAVLIYILLGLTEISTLLHVIVGFLAGIATYWAVLWAFHRTGVQKDLSLLMGMLGSRATN